MLHLIFKMKMRKMVSWTEFSTLPAKLLAKVKQETWKEQYCQQLMLPLSSLVLTNKKKICSRTWKIWPMSEKLLLIRTLKELFQLPRRNSKTPLVQWCPNRRRSLQLLIQLKACWIRYIIWRLKPARKSYNHLRTKRSSKWIISLTWPSSRKEKCLHLGKDLRPWNLRWYNHRLRRKLVQCRSLLIKLLRNFIRNKLRLLSKVMW